MSIAGDGGNRKADVQTAQRNDALEGRISAGAQRLRDGCSFSTMAACPSAAIKAGVPDDGTLQRPPERST